MMTRYFALALMVPWWGAVPAQSQPAQNIGTIPGMPVPKEAKSAPAPSEEGARAEQGKGGGLIARVTVAKEEPSAALGDKRPAEAARQSEVRPSYRGVTPPSRLFPDNRATFEAQAGNQLTWIGFLPQSETLFVQTQSPTTYEEIGGDARHIELRLKDVKLSVPNNARSLEMHYFKTRFERASVRREGRDVRVHVELKERAEHGVTQRGGIIEITLKPSEK